MPEKIRVLVVDGAAETREELARRLADEPGIEIAGSADSGQAAIDGMPSLRPDLALIDLHLPDLDGIRTTEVITARYPWVSVIMLSREAEPGCLRRAMLAGARHFLVRPFPDEELVRGIRQVYELDNARRAAQGSRPAGGPTAPGASPAGAAPARLGKIFTFYSAKGGVGCTTIACNVAVALKQETGKEVAIFDCGLLFGDVGVVLNLNPRQTIVDLLPRMADLDAEILDAMMVSHASGVKVLLAPASPEKAELVTAEHVRKVLATLREQFDYLVIDTWPTFEERILHVLDASDKIVVPTTLEMPAIKNSKLLMDVASALAYPPEKIALVLNRADNRAGIRVQDVEHILQRQFVADIVSDGRLTTLSLNEGVPFVMARPDATISHNVVELARKLAGIAAPVAEAAQPGPAGGLFRKLLGS